MFLGSLKILQTPYLTLILDPIIDNFSVFYTLYNLFLFLHKWTYVFNPKHHVTGGKDFEKHACVLRHVWFFATPWTVAGQAPLSLGLLRQEYWRYCCFLLLGSTQPRDQIHLLHLLYWQVGSLPVVPPGIPLKSTDFCFC